MQLPSDLDQIIRDLRKQRDDMKGDLSTATERLSEIDLIVEKLNELRDRADETLSRHPKAPKPDVSEWDDTRPKG